MKKATTGLDPAKSFKLDEAVAFVKKNATAKFDETIEIAMNLGIDPRFDETIEIAMNLGIDPRHADQNVRGVVNELVEPGAALDHAFQHGAQCCDIILGKNTRIFHVLALVQQAPLPVLDQQHGIGPDGAAAVGDHGIGAGHLQRVR